MPFEHYQIYTVPNDRHDTSIVSNIAILDRILSKAKIQEIYFPLWIKYFNEYVIAGFLCCAPNNFHEILISFPNFFKLAGIIVCLNNRKSYGDQKKA